MIVPQEEIQINLSQQSFKSFWWDNVRFICGSSRNIKYSRPDVNHYGICRFETRTIEGTRLLHTQLSKDTTDIIIGLPPTVAFATLGAAIGAKIGGGIGAGVGAAIGATFGFITPHALGRILVDERGTIWIFVHKRTSIITQIITGHRIPIFLRLGSKTLWDFCRHTSGTPRPS